MKLESQCKIKSREIVPQPANTVTYTQSYEFTEPFINLTNMVEDSTNFQNQNLSEILPDYEDSRNIDNDLGKSYSLQSIVEKIQTIKRNKILEEKLEKSQKSYYLHLIIVIILVVLICMIYVTCKCLKLSYV